MPRVPRAHLDARRQEILAAAFRRFARRGFHGTTMHEIAEEAGLSAGALYRYFDGKDALIEALAAAAAGRRAAALEALEPGGGAEALAGLVARMTEDLRSEAADASVRLDVRLWAEALDHEDVLELAREAFGSLREPIADYVRAEREAGRIRQDIDPGAVSRVVASLLTGLELQRAHDPDLDLEAYQAAVRALVSGLAPG